MCGKSFKKIDNIDCKIIALTPKGLRKPKRPFVDLGSVF
jgi:hypothetical protein